MSNKSISTVIIAEVSEGRILFDLSEVGDINIRKSFYFEISDADILPDRIQYIYHAIDYATDIPIVCQIFYKGSTMEYIRFAMSNPDRIVEFYGKLVHVGNISSLKNGSDGKDELSWRSNSNEIDLIVSMAEQSNLSFNSGNTQRAVSFMNDLFKSCYGRNGHKLLQLSSRDTQTVGLAFSSIALHMDFSNRNQNSIAAENAFYCLARNVIETSNRHCTPALFSLIYEQEDLLKDIFLSLAKRDGWSPRVTPIGIVGSLDFLENFKFFEYYEKSRLSIMFYLLEMFYDVNNRVFTVRNSMPSYNIPTEAKVNEFLKQVRVSFGDQDTKTLLDEGEIKFLGCFRECQDVLWRTKNI